MAKFIPNSLIIDKYRFETYVERKIIFSMDFIAVISGDVVDIKKNRFTGKHGLITIAELKDIVEEFGS